MMPQSISNYTHAQPLRSTPSDRRSSPRWVGPIHHSGRSSASARRASRSRGRGRIPSRAPIPWRALFEAAWRALKPERMDEVRLLIVENTLHLEELWLSEALLKEVEAREDVEAVGEPFPLGFDSGGHLVL